MATVVPSATPQTSTNTSPPPTAHVKAPPPDLLRLEVGSKLEAQVLQATNRGSAEIDTAFGKLTLSTKFPLPPQANLQLQLIGKGTALQMLITAIQGKSPQALLRPSAPGAALTSPTQQGSAPAQTGANSPTSPTPLTLTVGAQAIATKTGSAPMMGQPTVLGTSTLPGATSSSAASPSSSLIAAAQPGQSGVQPAAGSAMTGTAGTSKPINQALNQTGSRFSVRITAVVPMTQLASAGGLPQTGTPTLSVGQTVTGVVTANTHHGQAVVQTHAGPINLATPNPLPPGTTVSFVINGPLAKAPSDGAALLAGRGGQVILETHLWPQLDEALQTISDSNPALGSHTLSSVLPRADSTLAANIMLLIAALRGADIRDWFGDAPVRALQRLRPELLTRLREDFVQIAQLSDDTAGDWRAFPIPLVNSDQIEQIRLYLKRQNEQDDPEDGGAPGARFVIDLDLSRIGHLQLDGLVSTQPKQFDLIIRTDLPLADTLRNGIRDIFTKASDQTGQAGGLSFQSTPANFIEFTAPRPDGPETGVLV